MASHCRVACWDHSRPITCLKYFLSNVSLLNSYTHDSSGALTLCCISSLEGKPSHTMQNEVGAKPGGTAVTVQLNLKLLTAHMTVQNEVGG